MTDFTELVDLASERLGGAVVAANDEFFAPKENLVRESAPVWREGEYTERGKWMDGWETRRRRTPGYDWCILRLGLAGVVRGFVVDTSFFRGNYPEACSIEGASSENGPWRELLGRSQLQGDTKNEFAIESTERLTHLRLNIFPDGGVARLRVHGEVVPDWDTLIQRGGQIDLAAVENGGSVIAASDMFFGHRHNLIMPGRGTSMADGWETKRRRGPGWDWCIVKLGRAGVIDRFVVDTIHFKGNAPGECSIEGTANPDGEWVTLLPKTTLEPHTLHEFNHTDSTDSQTISYVRLNIFPDGGVSRLRVFARV